MPLVAASELAVALDAAAWLPEDGPFYSCDLADLDVQGLSVVDASANDEPEFDLAQGEAPRRRVELAYDDSEKAVVEWRSAAADFLGTRDWQGLEVKAGETPVPSLLQLV